MSESLYLIVIVHKFIFKFIKQLSGIELNEFKLNTCTGHFIIVLIIHIKCNYFNIYKFTTIYDSIVRNDNYKMNSLLCK